MLCLIANTFNKIIIQELDIQYN